MHSLFQDILKVSEFRNKRIGALSKEMDAELCKGEMEAQTRAYKHGKKQVNMYGEAVMVWSS